MGQIGRIGIQPRKVNHVPALRLGGINHLPKRHPTFFQPVVLEGEDLDLPAGEARGVGLLPLRADGVVNPVAMPLVLCIQGLEVVLGIIVSHPGHDFPGLIGIGGVR